MSRDDIAAVKGFQPNEKHWGVPWGLARMSHREPELDEYIYDDLSKQEQTYAYVIDSGIRITHKVYVIASALSREE